MLSAASCAVLFDLDGVIVDSKEAHFLAFQRFGEEAGYDFTRETFTHIFGMHNNEIFPILFGHPLPQAEIDRMAERKEAIVREMIRGHVAALPGAAALVRALRDAGFHLAIGTSTPLANVELILGELGLREFFQTIISAENVKEGKPHPQVFLLGAEALGIPPERCVVVEDAVAGVHAAHNGGMKALAVTTNHSREALGKAERVVDSLEEVGAEDFLRLLR
ncbi:MAG: HAD family hydrolase [Armatimonadota bacterium]